MIGGVALGLAVVCLVLGGLVLVGYPLVVVLLARRRGRPARARAWTPKVSILLVCRNESKNLPRKIASLLALDYPKDKLEILVADDASTDGTVRILNAARAELPKLQIVRSSSHRGKPANLNALMARASGEIVVFNDARQPLDPQAIRALCAALADPEVGGATGDLVLPVGDDGAVPAMGAYWRYESALRRAEGALHSTLGGTGALYAVKRELVRPFERDLVLDDMVLPLRVVLGGHRFVFASEARAYDVFSESLEREFQRKVRTLAGNFQALRFERRLLKAKGNPIFWQFLFHKVGRLALPWLMVAAFALSAVASTAVGFSTVKHLGTALLLAQSCFYAAALAGEILVRLVGRAGPLGMARTIVSMNVATACGLFVAVAGGLRATWKEADSQDADALSEPGSARQPMGSNA
jgi:cellulose synthase/poly-beta-1,6-N-acetylglucosamine synthase-like glycosyltransferase